MGIEIETGRDRRYGPLDAPESMPAGSMMATKHGAWPETAYRGE